MRYEVMRLGWIFGGYMTYACCELLLYDTTFIFALHCVFFYQETSARPPI